jgi:hypothetical protein
MSSFNPVRQKYLLKFDGTTLFMPPFELAELQAIGVDMLSRCGPEIEKRGLTECYQPEMISAAFERHGGNLYSCLPATVGLRDYESLLQTDALISNMYSHSFEIPKARALGAFESMFKLQVSEDFTTANVDFVSEYMRSAVMHNVRIAQNRYNGM